MKQIYRQPMTIRQAETTGGPPEKHDKECTNVRIASNWFFGRTISTSELDSRRGHVNMDRVKRADF